MSLSPMLARTLVAVLVAIGLTAGTAFAANAETGVDVSRWQHGSTPLNWSSVKTDGISFAFIKATEGSSYTNPYFAGDWSATAAAGIYRGAYHFARPSIGTAVKQAEYFLSRAGLADASGDLPPVLDLEATGGLGVVALRRWTDTWLRTVQERTGRTPIIYTSPSFWETHLGNSTAFTGYPLWIAHYRVTSPRVPGGWPDWTFWQTTNAGRVRGISGDVDLNTFGGAPAELAALANAVPVQREPVPTEPVPTEPVPAVPTTTTLDASTTSVFAGQSVTFSGTVATQTGDPVGTRSVTVFRRDDAGTPWRPVASATTDTTGSFSVPVSISGPGSFRATAAGDAAYLPSTSAVRTITLRPRTVSRLELDSDRSAVRRGRSVKLYGHLTTAAGKAMPARRVTLLQRRNGSTRWTLVATSTTLSPTGWFQAYVEPTADARYKAVFAATPRFTRAVSQRVSVDVR